MLKLGRSRDLKIVSRFLHSIIENSKKIVNFNIIITDKRKMKKKEKQFIRT